LDLPQSLDVPMHGGSTAAELTRHVADADSRIVAYDFQDVPRNRGPGGRIGHGKGLTVVNRPTRIPADLLAPHMPGHAQTFHVVSHGRNGHGDLPA
jgi:hypothetical protein